MTLELDLVVVPVDGSEESRRAVEYAVAIAAAYDATVHVVYVLGEGVVRDIEAGDVDGEEVAADSEAFAEDLRAAAADRGVDLSNSIAYGFSTRSKLRHPGGVVLDTAEELDADFLVVPREAVTGDPGEVLEKAAEYVLLYASQPVLSV
jgi:nucleotide-binding universal stress UspA family protein